MRRTLQPVPVPVPVPAHTCLPQHVEARSAVRTTLRRGSRTVSDPCLLPSRGDAAKSGIKTASTTCCIAPTRLNQWAIATAWVPPPTELLAARAA